MPRKKNENVHFTERIENDFPWIKSKKMYAANKNRLCDWALDDFRRKSYLKWVACVHYSFIANNKMTESYGRATSDERDKRRKKSRLKVRKVNRKIFLSRV